MLQSEIWNSLSWVGAGDANTSKKCTFSLCNKAMWCFSQMHPQIRCFNRIQHFPSQAFFFFIWVKLSFLSQPNGGNDLKLFCIYPLWCLSQRPVLRYLSIMQEYFPTPLLVMCGPEGLTGTFQVGDVCAGREGRRKTKISTHLPICQMQTHTMSSRYVYFYHRRCSITWLGVGWRWRWWRWVRSERGQTSHCSLLGARGWLTR